MAKKTIFKNDDYVVKDLSLAEFGRKEMDLVLPRRARGVGSMSALPSSPAKSSRSLCR